MWATTHAQLQILREPPRAALSAAEAHQQVVLKVWVGVKISSASSKIYDGLPAEVAHRHGFETSPALFAGAALSIPPHTHRFSLFLWLPIALSPFCPFWSCDSRYYSWREVKGSHTRAEKRRKEVVRIARAERKGFIENQYPSFTFQTGQTPPATSSSSVYVQPKYSAIKMGLDWILKAFQLTGTSSKEIMAVSNYSSVFFFSLMRGWPR